MSGEGEKWLRKHVREHDIEFDEPRVSMPTIRQSDEFRGVFLVLDCLECRQEPVDGEVAVLVYSTTGREVQAG
jgi:hypothetical protein